jgi:tRNA-specific 2-thiouridylase
VRVLAAMSGGVDSAVAAARAVDAGHDVVGVHLALSRTPGSLRSGARGCCSVEDARDARRAADRLGIPFYVWDFADRFAAEVVDPFTEEYAAGRTPNPCVRCNERIKFAALLDKARGLGFDAVATGHYARLSDGVLRRARDPAKDQSYVLAGLTPEQLAGALFPLGESCKGEVRAEAAARGLSVAAKPDSHDVCFIADGDTAGWLQERLGAAPGEVVDAVTGAVVGRHSGAYAFTVGQRRGLGLAGAASDGRPRYVLSVSPVTRQVTVGPREALFTTRLRADRVVLHRPIAPDRRYFAQWRAHGAPLPCRAALADGGRLDVHLADGARADAVASGQLLAVYQGEVVAAAGTLTQAS